MKIVDDTLKSPNGKWSRKSLTAFVSFSMAIFLGSFIAVYAPLKGIILSQYATTVFDSFMIMGGYLLGVSVADKFIIKNNKEVKKDTEDEA